MMMNMDYETVNAMMEASNRLFAKFIEYLRENQEQLAMAFASACPSTSHIPAFAR